ncbi:MULTISPECIES: hypothetical protein [unclassified Marinobacter]|nr:hypothetical protein [Marinobacter sp. 1-4A]MBK1851994.1 hypothetical protein [Marinobacter sp. 1-4A]
MKSFIIAAFLVAMSGHSLASSVCDKASKEFDKAVEVYKKEGGTAFMKRVLKNGPLESDMKSLSQAQVLGQIEQFFGPIETATVLSTKELG